MLTDGFYPQGVNYFDGGCKKLIKMKVYAL